MNIREQTALIVRKDGQFIQTESAVIGGTLWTASAYDALKTRSVEKALRSAQRVGGELWLFNPVTGHLRPADMNKIVYGRKTDDRRDLQQEERNPQERSVEDEQKPGTLPVCTGASCGADSGHDVRECGAFCGADTEII